MDEAKVALVTGVSSGIGQATVILLANRGFRVFGTMRNPTEPNESLQNVEVVQLDVRDEESVRSGVRAVLDRAGRIDALVNNAGYALIGSSEETSIEEARDLFETNFFGVLRMSRAVLPIMRGQGYGRIVNVGSVVGFVPAPYQAVYAASKHALEGYSESLDHEVRRFRVRVSVIEPGFTRTKMSQNSQVAQQPLEVYANERNGVLQAVRESIEHGADPGVVASVILEALTSRSARLRYPAGGEAKFLRLLRKFAPSGLFDRGLRKQFGLGGA